MEYFSKNNIAVISILSILLVISASFIMCNPSVAHYKTRITVDTVNLEITPYQPVNAVVEETPVDTTTEDQQEILEEDNSLEQNVN